MPDQGNGEKCDHERVNREELADFLRRRRDTLQPADVGVTPGGRRRTRGLRREEVAALAGISTDYYTRLEQQRGPQPTQQVAASLARALRLTQDERDHLFRLVGLDTPARVRRSDQVSPALLRVFELLDGAPALVMSDLGETFAHNPLAVALLGDHTRHSGLAGSAYYRWFTDPAERLRFPEEDHAHQSEIHVAALRAALTVDAGEPRARHIIDELLRRSAEFAELWERHEVLTARYDDRKVLVHPAVGRIAFDCQVLFSENRAQLLVVMTPRPGTDSRSKLELLSALGDQQFTR